MREFGQKNGLSAVALSALLWDWTISLDDEVQYMWRSPLKTNKWVYFVSRYLGIISTLVDNAMIFLNAYKPVPEETCRRWICFETAVSMILFGLTEFIQVLRVYALYHQNPKLRIALILWFSLAVAGCVHYLWYIATRVDFDLACAMGHLPAIGKVYSAIIIANEAIILFLLFWRCKVIAPSRASLEAVPVAYIVLRDGVLLFLAFCGMMAISTVYHVKQHNSLFVTPAIIGLLSIAACRMALNLQSMKRPGPRTSSLSELHLTTLPISTGVLSAVNQTSHPSPPSSTRMGTPTRNDRIAGEHSHTDLS